MHAVTRRQRVWEAFIQPEGFRALLAYRLCTLTLDEQTCPVEKEGKKGMERKRKAEGPAFTRVQSEEQ